MRWELLPGSVFWEVTGHKPKGEREFLGPQEKVQSDCFSRWQGERRNSGVDGDSAVTVWAFSQEQQEIGDRGSHTAGVTV